MSNLKIKNYKNVLFIYEFYLLHLKYKPDCPGNQAVLKNYGKCLTWMQESSFIYISYESKPLETALSLISEAINQFWIVTVTRRATRKVRKPGYMFSHIFKPITMARGQVTMKGIACTIERIEIWVSINIVEIRGWHCQLM